MAVIVDGRLLPRQQLAATPAGTLIVRLPGQLAAAARKGILLVFSALPPERAGMPDLRLLGLPILSIASIPMAISLSQPPVEP
jgi:hypothetical protein